MVSKRTAYRRFLNILIIVTVATLAVSCEKFFTDSPRFIDSTPITSSFTAAPSVVPVLTIPCLDVEQLPQDFDLPTGGVIVKDLKTNKYYFQYIQNGERMSFPITGKYQDNLIQINIAPDANLYSLIQVGDTENNLIFFKANGDETSKANLTENWSFTNWLNKGIVMVYQNRRPVFSVSPFTGKVEKTLLNYPNALQGDWPPTHFEKWETFFIYSPTLEKVIYLDDNFKELIANTENQTSIKPVQAETTQYAPAWSPNGEYFIQADTHNIKPNQPIFEIFLFNENGEVQSQLTHLNGLEPRFYIWSPDSQNIVAGDEQRLTVINMQEQSQVLSVCLESYALAYSPIWLPNNKQIITQVRDDSGQTFLVLVDILNSKAFLLKNSENFIPIGWIRIK